MTKKDFLGKCHEVLRKFEDKDTFDKCICEILHSGCIDLEKCPNNYIPIYWVMGALFKRVMSQCLDGSIDKKTRRIAHKEAKNIARFIPWWF